MDFVTVIKKNYSTINDTKNTFRRREIVLAFGRILRHDVDSHGLLMRKSESKALLLSAHPQKSTYGSSSKKSRTFSTRKVR